MDAVPTVENNFTLHQSINTITWVKVRKDQSTKLMILAASFVILYHGTNDL